MILYIIITYIKIKVMNFTENKSLNFSVGPVMMDQDILDLGAQNPPYFRTKEFSELMFENEKLLLELMDAPLNSKAVFITGSGTSGMEAAVMNLYSSKDNVIVVNGGSFGERLVQLLTLHEVPFTEIKLEYGKQITKEILSQFENKGYTGFILQHDETSTGTLYDMDLVSDFCKRNNLFLTVDCISSFLADKMSMKQWNAGAIIIGSQKAIALPPGISALGLNEKAVERINSNKTKSMYFDLKDYLKNMERGQTPFTPAVSILIQMNARMKKIITEGGIKVQTDIVRKRAEYFRSKITDLPVKLFSESPAYGVTALEVSSDFNAHEVFEIIKDKYNIFICPNGGALVSKVFRIGHIGNISIEDIDKVCDALHDVLLK